MIRVPVAVRGSLSQGRTMMYAPPNRVRDPQAVGVVSGSPGVAEVMSGTWHALCPVPVLKTELVLKI